MNQSDPNLIKSLKYILNIAEQIDSPKCWQEGLPHLEALSRHINELEAAGPKPLSNSDIQNLLGLTRPRKLISDPKGPGGEQCQECGQFTPELKRSVAHDNEEIKRLKAELEEATREDEHQALFDLPTADDPF